MADAKRRLAAILSADVAGYSRLMGDDERATVATLNAYRAVFRDRIGQHDGRVVDTAGDSVLAVFDSVVEAVECAVEVQSELETRNQDLSESRRMSFRIGVNAGDVIEQDDGTIYGDGVNIAARLESLAKPGTVCASETARLQAEDKLDFVFEDIGAHEVKNIARPVRAYRVAVDQTFERKSDLSQSDTLSTSSEGPALAVLPFTNLSPDPEQAYFADGIVEEIITELSRFGDLRVLGRISTLQYRDRAEDVREIGRALDVDFVLEGSVRRGGDRLRVTAQLLDAKDGGHLWAETYERNLSTAEIFDVQDDITACVVAKVGGGFGAVAREWTGHQRQGRASDLGAYDLMGAYYIWARTLNEDDYWPARDALEKAVEVDPSYADARAGLAFLYGSEATLFYDLRPDSLDRSLATAQKAVELWPDRAIALRALAFARLNRREDEAFFKAAERSLKAHPNDSFNMGLVGGYMCQAGDWERGLALLETAKARNPISPAWWTDITYIDHYRKGEFEQALAIAQDASGSVPATTCLWAAAAYGELGRSDDAKTALDELFRVKPDIVAYLNNYRPRLIDHVIDGLRKAGLDASDQPSST